MNAYCYWKLRDSGLSVKDATNQLEGKSIAYKNELLFQFGINYNDLPAWQKRGIGFYYDTTVKSSFNPLKGEPVAVNRRELKIDMQLPLNEPYDELIRRILFKNIEVKI